MVISKKTESQNAVISFPVSYTDKEAIAQLASSDGVNSADFIVCCALNKPLETAKMYDLEVQQSFEEMILNVYQLLGLANDLFVGEAKEQLLNALQDLAKNLSQLEAHISQR
ncbi:hypothetical protein [Dapis sp. BLCC M229]|uniref:hypothetical protein n=1 Tax=Dapis sp. BLCC M229 TaxID=3400188 RepID=UPI003CF29D6E